eukprot:TRINITY_DN9306_c0_g1_i5.p1 TRINITY_DN9306_c0_g1~~TRINITY_DN9306_c0_g1_i5.p1  ORF type:complete len:487 (-),score=71.63 TRINITY_DN9306_c0_g1_i5:19-1479(-)
MCIRDSSNAKALTFEELSRYAGLVTTDWIESDSEDYYIYIDYRGKAGERTGAFLGYMTKEAENIVKSLALDNDQKMDNQQKQFFVTGDGEWKTYQFYLSGSKGIKLILEKGMYFGLIENYDMAFKKLKVIKYSFPNSKCTENSEDKIYTSYYFGQVFKDLNFKGTVYPEFIDHGEKAEITFKFPDYQVGCVLNSMFALNSQGKVIEGFKPIESTEDGYKVLSQTITLSELNDYGCKQKQLTRDGTTDKIEYTCDISLHFYLNYDKQFANRQEEYDWVNENSYVIFRSYFSVQVNKETSTIFNTLIQTLITNQICQDKCTLDMSLTLQLKIKNSKGKYVIPMAENTIIWGDYVDFQITSDPSDYYLSIMDIYVQTGSQTGDEYTQLGEMFVSSFVQNVNKGKGETTFSMMISGEAGLDEGKKFNLKFLMKSEPASTRMLEDQEKIVYGADQLPVAQITDQPTTFKTCLLYTSPSPRDRQKSRMPSSA